MKLFFTPLLLLNFTLAAQWTRVQQLPSSDIGTVYTNNGIIYAGGKAIVYFSFNGGQTWDSTSRIPDFLLVDNLIVYKNELYASSYSKGVFKTADNGTSWQDMNTGIFPYVSGFNQFAGKLFAATLGSGAFELDSSGRDRWVAFSSGLSNQSSNLTAMASTGNVLVAGTLANALYARLPINSSTWEEQFLLNRLSPNEGVYSIIAAHDSLLLAGTSGSFYLNTDGGDEWSRISDRRIPNLFSSLVNAQQAVLISTVTFDGVNFNTSFHYIKKDSLASPFIAFSFMPDHYTYKIEIAGNRLWNASNRGLFYMPLSDLAGITAAGGPTADVPLKYIILDAELQHNRTAKLHWKTGSQTNVNHYTVQHTPDSLVWKNLAEYLPLSAQEYDFTDLLPEKGTNYYRIIETENNGTILYSNVSLVTVAGEDKIKVWPNPVTDVLHLQGTKKMQADIFDAVGRKLFSRSIQPGSHEISLLQLKPGNYFLKLSTETGIQMIQFLKL